jgi:DNA-binding transcriptional MerR regulator
VEKAPDAFRTISEAAEQLRVPQHVLRFWETRFTQIKPMKRAGGRRYYRPADMETLSGIRSLLYEEGYTIKGVQRIFKEEGNAYVSGVGRGEIKPRQGDALREGAPKPGTAKAAPRIVKPGGLKPPPAVTEVANVAAPRLSAVQSDSLKLALKDLTDARRLLGS